MLLFFFQGTRSGRYSFTARLAQPLDMLGSAAVADASALTSVDASIVVIGRLYDL